MTDKPTLKPCPYCAQARATELEMSQQIAKDGARIANLTAELNTRAAPKVKALEWTGPRETDGIYPAYDAKCFIGHYIACVTDDGRALAFRVGYGGSMYPDGETVEDAKAAAQADFERRILGALE